MALIYRRNPHGSRLTTTIPLRHQRDAAALNLAAVGDGEPGHDHPDDKGPTGAVAGRLRRWLRCPGAGGPSTPGAGHLAGRGLRRPAAMAMPDHAGSVRQRILQTLWLALAVYTFLGLPIIGRILNIGRFVHRFSASSAILGLAVGLVQDIAVFVQASTVIVLIKAVCQPHALQRRLSSTSSSAPSATTTSLSSTSALHSGTGISSSSSSTLMLAQERYPHSYGGRFVHLPAYQSVRTQDYDGPPTTTDGDLEGGTSALMAKHLTVVASSSNTLHGAAFPWSTTTPASSSVLVYRLKQLWSNLCAVLLLKVVVILATIASVADFCLQISMHPRLNRAFVNIFFNYAAHFVDTLTEADDRTPIVLFAWTSYLLLVTALTFGFYYDRLPLLPDFLTWSPSASTSTPSVSGDRQAACSRLRCRRTKYRKNSSALPTMAEEATRGPVGIVKTLYRNVWAKVADSDMTTSTSVPRLSRRRRNSSLSHINHGGSVPTPQLSNAFGLLGSSTLWMRPKSALGIVLHCVVVSFFVTVGALIVSLIVHTPTIGSAEKHTTGVDMTLMSNAMFSLQTETFFTRKNNFGGDQINCTIASGQLLLTLGKSEKFETTGLGNSDSCALLWRKTTGYHGDTLWDINWNKSSTSNTSASTQTEIANGTVHTNVSIQQPNIIVINMEAWRYQDVGVLGGAEKLKRFRKSATPNFDRLSRDGILYRKHYTQCVQTSPTLLTNLFGMLPYCAESNALKSYGTNLNVQGLPQFLKSRGYYNMFWSAVDLSWESWDKFLTENAFDKLVDDKKVRRMLHEALDYKDREDDHFSWGIHDNLSFDMLLHALEAVKNTTISNRRTANSTAMNTTSALQGHEPLPPSIPKHRVKNGTDLNNVEGSTFGANSVEFTVQTMNTSAFDAATSGAHVGVTNQSSSFSNASTARFKGWEGLEEPYFINMYSISSHNPWNLPSDYSAPDLSGLYSRYNRRYIDTVHFSDAMLGQFVDSLRAKGLMNNTIVIIQGDHGYGRMEHDNNPTLADSAVYDEASRVPFLILADDFLSKTTRGQVVDQLTMQADLMATIADILGVTPERPLHQHGYGHSMRRKRQRKLRKQLEGMDFDVINARNDGPNEDSSDRRVLLCNPFNGMTKGVRTEDYKYVFDPHGAFKVFDLEQDPGEKQPIQKGYDMEQMDEGVREMYDFVNEHISLNQFLFEASKFTAPLPPAPTPTPLRLIEEATVAAAGTDVDYGMLSHDASRPSDTVTRND